METQRKDTEKTQKRKIRSDSFFFGCICILIAAFVCQRVIQRYPDNDFFHIATSGRWITEHGIMRQNVFFVEDGYATVIQQWLYAILLFLSYHTAGFYGVMVFTFFQIVLLGVIGYLYLKTRDVEHRISVIGALLLMLSVQYPNCRPEIISMILLVAQFLCQERYRKHRKKGILYVLPLLMLFEINLHAAYAFLHFIVLLPYLVPVHRLPMCKELFEWCAVRQEETDRKDYMIPVILMVAAMFANPYGVQAILIVMHSGNIALLNIKELQATSIREEGAILFGFGVLFLGFTIWRKSLRESTALMFAGCLLMGLIVSKNILLFSLVLLLLWGDLFEDRDCGAFWAFLNKAPSGYAKAAFTVSILISAALLTYGTVLRISPEHEISWRLLPELSDSEVYPADAIDYILTHEEAPEDLRVMNSFNNGSAFLWNGIGHVYIEPKTEPYLRAVNGKRDIVSEYVQITTSADSEQIVAFLERYDFDYICCSYYMQGLLVWLEQTERYECVMVSEKMVDAYEEETGYSQPVYRLYIKME